MSGNIQENLESFESPLSQEKEREVRRLLELLDTHRPRITIDREYQKNLRKTLLQKKHTHTISIAEVSWFGFMSGFGVLATSFIAVFGLWNMWEESGKILGFTKNEVVAPMNMMYSEEKAEMLNTLASTASATTLTADIPNGIAMKGQARIRQYQAEKSSLDAEVADISSDMYALADSIPLEDSAGAPALALRSIAPETSLNSLDPVSNSVSPSMATSLPESALSSTRIAPPSLQDVLSKTAVSYPLPDYPSTMKVYSKDTPWTPLEIESRSGTGLEITELSTEPSKNLLLRKIETRLADRSILGPGIVSYAPMKNTLKSKNIRYYLVPVITYTLESSEKVSISLIRGF